MNGYIPGWLKDASDALMAVSHAHLAINAINRRNEDEDDWGPRIPAAHVVRTLQARVRKLEHRLQDALADGPAYSHDVTTIKAELDQIAELARWAVAQ